MLGFKAIRSFTNAIRKTYAELNAMNLTDEHAVNLTRQTLAKHGIDIEYFDEMLSQKPLYLRTNLAEILTCYPEHISSEQARLIINDIASAYIQHKQIKKTRGFKSLGFSANYYRAMGTPEEILQDVYDAEQLYNRAVLAGHQPTIDAIQQAAFALA